MAKETPTIHHRKREADGFPPPGFKYEPDDPTSKPPPPRPAHAPPRTTWNHVKTRLSTGEMFQLLGPFQPDQVLAHLEVALLTNNNATLTFGPVITSSQALDRDNLDTAQPLIQQSDNKIFATNGIMIETLAKQLYTFKIPSHFTFTAHHKFILVAAGLTTSGTTLYMNIFAFLE